MKKNAHWYTNGTIDKQISDSDDVPEGFYRGRKKYGPGTAGTKWITNGEIQKLLHEDEELPEGFMYGKLPDTEEHKKKLSKALKGRVFSKEHRKRISESHHTKEYKEKINATRMEKHGVENFFQNPEVLARALHNSHTEEATHKKIQTCQKHFGVDYPMQSDEVRQKANESWTSKSEEEKLAIVEKAKQTKEERYGDPNYNNKEKAKQTSLERFGASNPSKSKDVQQKMQNTNMLKRGVHYPLEDPAVLEKQIATNLERYGVMYNIQLPQSHIGSGKDSKPNRDFASLLDMYHITYEREFSVEKYQFDFKVGNILLEINPTATHNSLWNPYGDHSGIDPYYHYNKTKIAVKNGYRVIHIFDWDDQEKIIKNFLLDKPIIYARNTRVIELSTKQTNTFLNEYHLQNKCNNQKICLGLLYNDTIVSIMTFGKPRYNKKYQWELLRYCSNSKVIGGAKKLFQYFIKTYNPNSIISYCDKSKFLGQVYLDLGFILQFDGTPMKHWYNQKEKLSHITDNLLRQRGFDQLFKTNYGKGTSNEQLIIDRGYVSVYDCGQNTYIWTR